MYMINYDVLLIGHITTEEFKGNDGSNRYYYGGESLYSSYAMKMLDVDLGILTKMRLKHQIIFDLISVSKEAVLLRESEDDTHFVCRKKDENDKAYKDIEVVTMAEPFEISDIPPEYKCDIYYMSGTMKEEYSDGFVKELAERGKVAATLKVFLNMRNEDNKLVQLDDYENKSRDFPCITYLKATPEEAEILTGEKDIEKAAKKIKSLGVKEVFIVDEDNIYVYNGKSFLTVPIRAENAKAFIGIDETAFAVYLSKRLETSISEATVWAAAAAAIKKEYNDPIKHTKADLEQYIAKHYSDF